MAKWRPGRPAGGSAQEAVGLQARRILIGTFRDFAIEEQHLEAIAAAAPGFEIICKREKEMTPADVAAAEVVFGRPKPAWVAAAPNVKWVQLASAGADGWLGVRPDDLLLTKASGTFGVPIAEWAMGAILMLTRNLHIYRDQQRERQWRMQWSAREIMGSTVGLLGLGDIGREVAQRARAFGCRVVGFRRRMEPVPFVDAVLPLEQVLAEADFLVMVLPATPATYHLIDAERLAQMKPGAYLINAGRGSTVDEAALVEALRSGHLAGAALDVFEDEPLPAESPLWQMEQVIISPHASFISPARNTDRRMAIFCQNLKRYLAGEPLLNLVDRQTGY